MKWLNWSPRPREERASYTDLVIAGAQAAAAGTSTGALQTAALEACSGAWARGLASADVAPKSLKTAGVDAVFLADVGRRLIRSGDALYVIEIGPAGAMLLPASRWDVHGSFNPATWRYRVTLAGPDTTTTRTVDAAGVVHLRWSAAAHAPWRGCGPLGWATATGRLAGSLEQALADETAGPRGSVLPVPEGLREPTDDAADADPLAPLRADLAKLRGGLAVVESMAGGFGDRGGRPDSDWKARRLGADPPEGLIDLRAGAALAVYAACGVPPSLVTLPADGTGQREAWRRFLHGSVAPVARIVQGELRAKLDAPNLALDFTALHASDLTGRARAFRSLAGTDAKIPEVDARRLAGLA